MEQGADDLDLHPLAERKLSDGLAHEVAHVEQRDQLVPQREEVRTRDLVDRAVELEGVERRQVPLQLVPVAHDERDPAQEVALALRGDVPEDACLPAGHVEETGQHLEGRRLAGAVRAEEADDLAGLDLERDAVDSANLAHLAAHETLRRRLQALVALGDLEDLQQAVDVDRRLTHPDLCARSGSASADPDRATIPKGGRFAAVGAVIISSAPLQLAVALRIQLAATEDPQPEWDRDERAVCEAHTD